jgi:hypothetical protein
MTIEKKITNNLEAQKITPDQFEVIMTNFQAIVLEYGSKSEEAAEALNELENIWGGQRVALEHLDVMVKLGILPRYELYETGEPRITREEWADYFSVPVEQFDEFMRERGMLPSKTDFQLALEKYVQTANDLGADSDEAGLAFALAMDIAPPEYRAEANKVLHEMFDMPRSVGVNHNDQPVYSIKDIAEMLDMPVDEAIQKAEAITDVAGRKIWHSGEEHRLH